MMIFFVFARVESLTRLTDTPRAHALMLKGQCELSNKLNNQDARRTGDSRRKQLKTPVDARVLIIFQGFNNNRNLLRNIIVYTAHGSRQVPHAHDSRVHIPITRKGKA
jgi:hypothetical protein